MRSKPSGVPRGEPAAERPSERRRTEPASLAALSLARRSAEVGVCGVGGFGDARAEARKGDEVDVLRRRYWAAAGEPSGEAVKGEGDGRVLGDERAGVLSDPRDDAARTGPGRAGEEEWSGPTVAAGGRDESELSVRNESMML